VFRVFPKALDPCFAFCALSRSSLCNAYQSIDWLSGLLCELTPACVLAESDDDLEEPVIFDLTMYVYIEKLPIPGKKRKLSDSDKYVQKGPFKLKSMENYATFLAKISTALPCPVLNIIQEKITWKCQTPQNSPSLPLGKELGYSAMLEAIKAKQAGSWVGIVMMPPPVKPVEQLVRAVVLLYSLLTPFFTALVIRVKSI